MASEILAVPERYILDVCHILRAGMEVFEDAVPYTEHIDDEVFTHLRIWCDEMEEYMGETITSPQPANNRLKRW